MCHLFPPGPVLTTREGLTSLLIHIGAGNSSIIHLQEGGGPSSATGKEKLQVPPLRSKNIRGGWREPQIRRLRSEVVTFFNRRT